MKIHTFPHNFVSIILNSNEQGQVSWSSSKSLFNSNPLEKDARELAILFFGNSNLFLEKDSFLTNEYIHHLNPTIMQDSNDNGLFLCSANTSAYLGLPGENFIEEMYSMIPFLKECKRAFEDFYITFPDTFAQLSLSVTNSSEEYTFANFHIVSLSACSTFEEKTFLEKRNQELNSMIKHDTYLTAFSHHYLNMLNQIGSYAYSHTNITAFFEYDNPYNVRITTDLKKYQEYEQKNNLARK